MSFKVKWNIMIIWLYIFIYLFLVIFLFFIYSLWLSLITWVECISAPSSFCHRYIFCISIPNFSPTILFSSSNESGILLSFPASMVPFSLLTIESYSFMQSLNHYIFFLHYVPPLHVSPLIQVKFMIFYMRYICTIHENQLNHIK